MLKSKLAKALTLGTLLTTTPQVNYKPKTNIDTKDVIVNVSYKVNEMLDTSNYEFTLWQSAYAKSLPLKWMIIGTAYPVTLNQNFVTIDSPEEMWKRMNYTRPKNNPRTNLPTPRPIEETRKSEAVKVTNTEVVKKLQSKQEKKSSVNQQEGKEINKKKGTIVFLNQTYNLETFHRKVVVPVEMIVWKDFDERFLFKLGMIEHMSANWDRNSEIQSVLKRFESTNYHSLQDRVSSAWAKWVFQIMDQTKANLETKYKIQNRIKAKADILRKQHWFTVKDFEILENALYCAYLIKDIQTQFKWITGREIAWVYNMWPRYMELKDSPKLNSETKWYVSKYDSVSQVISWQI